MTTQINENLRRLQKLSGILLEDDAFNSGRPNNGNHDDAWWAAKGNSGQYAEGPAGELLPHHNPADGLVMYSDESQNHIIVVDGYTDKNKFDEDMRKLVGDHVYSAYIDEPGVFEPVEDYDDVDFDAYVEFMSIKEIARLINRWAARNKISQMQRFDKTNMHAKP